jgi:hypothetical protein
MLAANITDLKRVLPFAYHDSSLPVAFGNDEQKPEHRFLA